MKGKTKTQKGITLIALIITIVVLLILAAVAIASITSDGVLNYAENAATQYNQAVKNEQDMLQGYIDYLNKHNGGTGSDEGDAEGDGSGNVGSDTISKTDSFIGYYADVDGNGTVDGIIFADLAFSESGQWVGVDYSYDAKSTLNNYVIRDATTEEKGLFKNAKEKVIVLTENRVEANDRFYVMALDDFITEDYTKFCWYRNAYGKMSPLVTELVFGTGRKNTNNMIEIWNKNGEEGGYAGATQSDQDMWKHIQGEVANGWFVPSRAELAAFGYAFTITQENYVQYGISGSYCTSSQCDTYSAWFVDVGWYFIGTDVSGGYYGSEGACIRLCTTF